MKRIIAFLLILSSALSFGVYGGIGYVENKVNSNIDTRNGISNQIAIVNLDEGVVNAEGQRIYYSDVFLKSLNNNYCVESANGALNGLESNKYSAVITFPMNTSINVESLNSSEPQSLDIEYVINSNLAENKYLETSELINSFKEEISNSLSYLYVSSLMTELHQAQDDIGALYDNNAAILSELDSLEQKNYITDLDITMMPSVEMMLNNINPEEYVNQANGITNQISDIYKDAYQTEYDRISGQLAELSEGIDKYSSWDTKIEDLKNNIADYCATLNGYCEDLNKKYKYLESYKGSLEDWNKALQVYKNSIDIYKSNADQIYANLDAWYKDLNEYKTKIIGNVNDDINNRNASIGDVNTKISNFNTKIDTLNKKITSVNEAVEEINEVISGLNDTVASYKEANSELQGKLDLSENEKATLQSSIDSLKKLVAAYDEAKGKYDDALKNYIDLNDEYLKSSMNDNIVITAAMIDEVEQCKNALNTAKGDLDSAYNKICELLDALPSTDSNDIPNSDDVPPTPDGGDNGDVTPTPPDNSPSGEPKPTLTPIPTSAPFDNVEEIPRIDNISEKDKDYIVPTCAIDSVAIPTFNYEAEKSDTNSKSGENIKYNTSENPNCTYINRIPDDVETEKISEESKLDIDVEKWFKENTPQDIQSLLGYVASVQTEISNLNPSEYLSVADKSYAYRLNNVLAQYGVLNNSIASDFLSNQSQNVTALNDAYSSYRSYVGTMKTDLENAYDGENESFTSTVDACITNIGEINENTNELLGDFATKMPNSRNGSDINTAVVDVMIDPIKLVNSSTLLESQVTSNSQAKQVLMIVGISTLSLGTILLVVSIILDKKKCKI